LNNAEKNGKASRMDYTHLRKISCDEFIDVLNRSTLGERRPVNDRERIATMLERADLLCTAWAADLLVGVARSVTDFSYCCYLSDLAVDVSFQNRGIGVQLLRLTQSLLHPKCTVILLAAPKAEGYYPKIGMVQHHSAWTTLASPLLPARNT
jgi:ribosomal protein S18 acetylase RimI-like enzyme